MKLPGNYPLRYIGVIMILSLLMTPEALCSEESARITDLTVRPGINEVELVVQGAIEYGYFPLSEPDRLVFDFPGTFLVTEGPETLLEEVEGACFRELRLSQFSIDPLISRLVLYLNEPATAIVSLDLEAGTLVIQVIPRSESIDPLEPGIGLTDLLGPTDPIEIEITPGAGSVEPDPITSEDVYEIISSDNETTIRCPNLTSDRVSVRQVRYPDRLLVRMFTGRILEHESPRFDQLDRGNIWNDVAKQWVSYIDRDGRGVVDLTIYLETGVGYTQSISSTGVPEIGLFMIPDPVVVVETEAILDTEESADILIAAYPGKTTEESVTEDAPQLMEETDTIHELVEIEVIEELEESEEVIENEEPEQIEEIEDIVEIEEPVDVTVNTVEEEIIITSDPVYGPTRIAETVEVIEDGSLIQLPTSSDDQDSGIEATISQAASVTSGGLPALPNVVRQNSMLDQDGSGSLYMRVGDVVVLEVDELVRASMGNPVVATLNVISREEILVTALAPGNTTLLTWEEGRGHVTREVSVLDATSAREEEIAFIIDDSEISVRILTSGDADSVPGVILEGSVATEEERARAQAIASLFAGERVTNLIEVTDPRQVLVEVRVIEVDSRALDEHLSQFSASARADNDDFTIGIITDILDPENPGGGMFDSRVRPGIVNGEIEDVQFDPIDIVLNELIVNRQATILSEPNVVGLSGHEAHFRVGGEIPYTYLGPDGVTVVEFKEFGISLDMTPTVDSQDNIMLMINPVVRTVDWALAIGGIPGFRTREMETVVQLRPGETLVIGGLIQSEITEIVSEIPFLCDIPILGDLFRSKRFTEDETELVIFLTPYILTSPEMSERILGVDIVHPSECY